MSVLPEKPLTKAELLKELDERAIEIVGSLEQAGHPPAQIVEWLLPLAGLRNMIEDRLP